VMFYGVKHHPNYWFLRVENEHCIRKFSHPYVCIILCCQLVILCLPNSYVYYHCRNNIEIFFALVFFFMHIVCIMPCGKVALENILIIKSKNKNSNECFLIKKIGSWCSL
jgi:hypothetical protein